MPSFRLPVVLRRTALIAVAIAGLFFLAPGPPDVQGVEPGVNCSSYAGPGDTCVIEMGDIWLCDPSYQEAVCASSIVAGDTVRWEYPSSGVLQHTTTACGADCDAPTASPLWDSGFMSPGGSFEYTFTTPGQYLYYCMLHPTSQRGLIRVLAPVTPVGDVNCSGEVNSIDAALVLQLSAGLVGSLACQENADANENGEVNSIDAALILQYVAGLIDTLPP